MRVEAVVLMRVDNTHEKGLNDWIWQRISAVFLTAYLSPILGFYALHAPVLSQQMWQSFLLHPAMKILGALAAISLFVHASIGSWVVATDYIKPMTIQRWILAGLYLIIFGSSIGVLVILWRF